MSEKQEQKKNKAEKKEEKETMHEQPDQTSEERKTDEKSLYEEKIAGLTNILQRLQADFENYKRRTDSEKAEQMIYANGELIKKFLPLLDNFELALKNSEKKEDFIKGMELIYSQFLDILKNEKVTKIECVGKEFNPNLHQALMAQASDKGPNTILEEFQSGYMIKDKVLRHSKVKVSK